MVWNPYQNNGFGGQVGFENPYQSGFGDQAGFENPYQFGFGNQAGFFGMNNNNGFGGMF